MKKIDARGLDCPAPVILTKKALEQEETVAVSVDNKVARDNIRRFGENGGYHVTIVENKDSIEMILTKGEGKEATINKTITVLIKTNVFGEGSPELGNLLMKNFLISLVEGDMKVQYLLLMNAGVKLSTENKDAVEILEELKKQGTEIFSCGTCLDYYHLKNELKIGGITNMYTATEFLLEAEKTIII